MGNLYTAVVVVAGSSSGGGGGGVDLSTIRLFVPFRRFCRLRDPLGLAEFGGTACVTDFAVGYCRIVGSSCCCWLRVTAGVPAAAAALRVTGSGFWRFWCE